MDREAEMAVPAESEPRLLINTGRAAEAARDDAAGAIWKLETAERHLDANVIALPAGTIIQKHWGPDLDVMMHVIAGSGRLTTESGYVDLNPGDLIWLPRRSQRQITAGRAGLRYLTVHPRRQSLVLEPPGPRGS
ncbi:hypothetical protein GCM10022236_48850 [Microlunatus ginsengisoli]|uniref:Cupin domain-containing protein n=2 Tax=Microlunatus ginsengisoli TaxID=363863 RepID=A0ABP7AUP8_9ACTN